MVKEKRKEFDLGTEEGRRNYQTDLDNRSGLYLAQQLLIDEIGKFDKEIKKYEHIT